MLNQTIGFVGTGQMATALAKGIVETGLLAGEQIMGYDPSPAAGQAFRNAVPGASLVESNAALAGAADVICLAVKPQYAQAACEELRGVLGAKLLISIAAGIPLRELEAWTGTRRLVRVMPNTPCLVGCGASAFTVGPGADADDAKLVHQLLAGTGQAFEVPESLLDAVTGLSGSGPAYVALFIEALSDGGVRAGLPRELATRLAVQTVRGTAEMLLRGALHPAELKDRVASPGGTTIAGLHALESAGVRGAVISAVEAAARRAREMGQRPS